MGLFSRYLKPEEEEVESNLSPYEEYVNTWEGLDKHRFDTYSEEKVRQINIIVGSPNDNRDILIGFKGKLLATHFAQWTFKYKDEDKEKSEKKTEDISIYYVINENAYESVEYFLVHRQLGNGITKCSVYQQWEYRELLDDLYPDLTQSDLLKLRDHILNYISKGEIQLADPVEAQTLFNDIEDGVFDYDDFLELTKQQRTTPKWGVEEVERYNKIG